MHGFFRSGSKSFKNSLLSPSLSMTTVSDDQSFLCLDALPAKMDQFWEGKRGKEKGDRLLFD
jgi:hypothetical protein